MKTYIHILSLIAIVGVAGCAREVRVIDYGPVLKARHGTTTTFVEADGKITPYADVVGGEAVEQAPEPGVVLADSAKEGGKSGTNIGATTARAVTVCQTDGIFSESSGACMAAATQKTIAERFSDFCTASADNANSDSCKLFVGGQTSLSRAAAQRRSAGYATGCGPIRYAGDQRAHCWSQQ